MLDFCAASLAAELYVPQQQSDHDYQAKADLEGEESGRDPAYLVPCVRIGNEVCENW